jgi:hypothetical protein
MVVLVGVMLVAFLALAWAARRARANPLRVGAAVIGACLGFAAAASLTFPLGMMVFWYPMKATLGGDPEGFGMLALFEAACMSWIAGLAAAPVVACRLLHGRPLKWSAVRLGQLVAAAGSLVALAIGLSIPPVPPGESLAVLAPAVVVVILAVAGSLFTIGPTRSVV